MKKILLLSGLMILMVAASAQRYQINNNVPVYEELPRSIDETFTPQALSITPFSQPEKPNVNAGDRTIVTVITIGAAGNAYGLYNGGRTALWADNNLNSVIFTHRMTVPPGSGYLAYDLSTDGGLTWTNNIQVYDPTKDGANARYPQGLIYNPVGNTDPNNAMMSYFGPTLDGSNGTSNWGGYAGGVHTLDQLNAPTQHDWSAEGPFKQNVPAAFHINPVNGDLWVFEPAVTDGLGNQYTDSLLITQGTLNASATDYDYDRWLMYAPPFTPGRASACEKIAFAPDGQIGYMTLLWDNGLDPFAAGFGYYPVIFKTTDGGETWGDPKAIIMSGPDGFDEVKYYLTDEQWEELWVPPAPHRDSVLYQTAFDHDMVVDMNGDVHISVTIGVASVTTPYAIIASGGYGATFHFYSLNQGECFAAQYVTHNKTFRGEFGGPDGISEDSRSQISTNHDGSKVFLSWLDTDFEGVDDNIMPDIHAWAFDVNTRMYTDVYNVTYLSEGWLEAYMGTASYYVFENENGYVVPFVYQTIPGGDPLNPVDFKYIYDFTITDADFSFGPHEPPQCGTPGDANGDGMVNVSDVVITINYILGNNPPGFVFANADVNGDGVVNVSDVVGIVNIILGGK
jgi:hypothetical protein